MKHASLFTEYRHYNTGDMENTTVGKIIWAIIILIILIGLIFGDEGMRFLTSWTY